MKTKLLMLLLPLAMPVLWAGVFQIGEGTSASSRAPLSGGNDYSWSKMIYTKGEINAAGLGAASAINGIGFYVDNQVSDCEFTNQQVFLRHTILSAYSVTNQYPDSTNATLVYAGTVTFQGSGWCQLAFNQAFEWDGVRNLEILWLNYHGESYSPPPRFCNTSTAPEERLVYMSADGAFPTRYGDRKDWRPNLQLITAMAPSPGIRNQNGNLFLEWASLSGATGYKVYASDDPYSFSETPVAELGAQPTSYSIPSGGRKFFRVKATY